jgi:hypothetical protein
MSIDLKRPFRDAHGNAMSKWLNDQQNGVYNPKPGNRTPEEGAAVGLEDYTVDGYRTLNYGLRTGVIESPEEHAAKLKNMDAAFEHFGVRLGNDGEVFRGVDLGDIVTGVKRPEGETVDDSIRRMFAPGTEFTDKAFVSTSTSKDRATGMFTYTDAVSGIMRIKVPKGTTVVTGHFREQELILNRGTRLRITGMRMSTDPERPLLYEIDAEIIPSDSTD